MLMGVTARLKLRKGKKGKVTLVLPTHVLVIMYYQMQIMNVLLCVTTTLNFLLN